MNSISVLKVNNDTELLDLGRGKFKFINCLFDKPVQKMFDYKCDLKLRVGGKVFHTHREVLTNASSYFAAMFSADMQERDQDTIELQTSEVGFSQLLDYIYHGIVSIDEQSIGVVLEAGRFFQVEWLVNACTIYMVQYMSFGDYTCALELADLFELGDISEAACAFLGMKFNVLLERGTAAKLCFEVLRDLLCSNVYLTISESELFAYLMEYWLDHPGLVELLEHLRLSLLTPEELAMLESAEFCQGDLAERVTTAVNYLKYPLAAHDLTSPQMQPRGSKPCLVIFSTNANITVLQVISMKTLTIFVHTLDMALLGSYIENCASCELGNFLVLAGGYDHGYISSNKLLIFDTKDYGLVPLEPMRQARVNFGFCAGGGRLYACGGVNHALSAGEDTEDVLATVEAFSLSDSRWTDLAPLPKPVCELAACWLDGYLYVSGGVSYMPDDPIPLFDFRRLGDGEVEWEDLPPMRHSRQRHATLAWSGHIYVFGGVTVNEEGLSLGPCRHNEMFSFDSMSWSELPASPREFGRVYDKWTLVDDTLLYICTGDEATKALRVFDLAQQIWVTGLDEHVGEECSHVALLNVAVHE